jgi:hypothetical protein
MKWELYNKRINKVSLKTSDGICSIVVFGDIIFPTLFIFGNHFGPLMTQHGITKYLSIVFISGWLTLSAIFFIWMFIDVSGNKYVRDKNGWLGILYLASIYAAPVYYWFVYRKSRISKE